MTAVRHDEISSTSPSILRLRRHVLRVLLENMLRVALELLEVVLLVLVIHRLGLALVGLGGDWLVALRAGLILRVGRLTALVGCGHCSGGGSLWLV